MKRAMKNRGPIDVVITDPESLRRMDRSWLAQQLIDVVELAHCYYEREEARQRSLEQWLDGIALRETELTDGQRLKAFQKKYHLKCWVLNEVMGLGRRNHGQGYLLRNDRRVGSRAHDTRRKFLQNLEDPNKLQLILQQANDLQDKEQRSSHRVKKADILVSDSEAFSSSCLDLTQEEISDSQSPSKT